MEEFGKYRYIIDEVCKREPSRRLARRIIPILIEWAKRGETRHTYDNLIKELGYSRFSGIGDQLGYVATILKRLSEITRIDIPTLNGLVIKSEKSPLPSNGFSFVVKEYGDIIEKEKFDIVNEKNKEAVIYPRWNWVLNSLGLSPYCAPNDCFYPDEVNEDELKEGHASQVLVNRYERNAEARKKCIELKGCLCAVCGMDFEKEYGEIGRGFIHVHHIVPLSSIGEDYVINYEKDLVPVCPNCHAMLHRKNPPYTIDELKELIALSNKAN